MKRACLLLVVALAFGLPKPAAAQSTLGAKSLYALALSRMASMPEPAYVNYVASVFADESTFFVGREPANGNAEFGFSVGQALGANHGSWPVTVRTSDGTTSILLDSGYALTTYPIFNATWSGAYVWLRYGFYGPQPPALELSSPSPSPPPLPSPSPEDTNPPVISIVRAIGTGAYAVEDRGRAQCIDGAAGRKVHLVPRSDPDTHPATDVTIDVRTNDICTIRFALRRTQFFALDGLVELHFGRFEGYELATSGYIELESRMPNMRGQKVTMSMSYTGVSFAAPSPAVFASATPSS